MGTSNFHTVNAGATYVIDYGEDEFAWSKCQEHLGTSIKKLDSTFGPCDSLISEHRLRSFPASAIGFWGAELTYLDISFELHINLFLRSGYHEAANLDYEFQWFIDGGDPQDVVGSVIDTLDEYIPDYYNINRGLWSIHKSKLENKLITLENELTKQVESILAQVSTPYGVSAQASNGECVYTKLEGQKR